MQYITEKTDTQLKSIIAKLSSYKKCIVVTGAGISVSGGIPVILNLIRRILGQLEDFMMLSKRNILKVF